MKMQPNQISFKQIVMIVFSLIIINGFSCKIEAQSNKKHEVRAVWIATVSNIDWPSKSNLSSEIQQKEFTEMLDLFKQNNFNTIVLQIRPAADAFYFSKMEPWSQWLTGEQGKQPSEFYDPLEFAIKECRKRGLDIHVWLNPYRASLDTSGVSNSSNHITKTHPEWFVNYGAVKYFNPGLPQIRKHVAGIVSDVVRRYDIDAVHLDDYFYPYKISNVEFPDSNAFKQYPFGFTENQKDDWRRHNVDLIIKQLHDSIKSIKPWVEFGISPFGVWRNNDKDSAGSKTKAGQTNYDDLYADVLKWQKENWIDYVVPQIYWHIGFKVADYATLLQWWSKNSFGCPVYIGHAPYRINKKSNKKSWRTSKEIIKQLELNQKYPNISGSFFFSAKTFKNNPLKLNKRIAKFYKYQALTPVNYKITQVLPEIPEKASIKVKEKVISLNWEKGNNSKSFVIYKFRINKPANIEKPEYIFRVTSETSLSVPVNSETNPEKYYFVITSLSSTNMESQAVYFK